MLDQSSHPASIYTNGEYLRRHPTWHDEGATWKAQQVLCVLERNRLAPRRICDIGCGSGGLLKRLHDALSPDCRFWGFDVSPQAIGVATPRAAPRLHFALGEFPPPDMRFDLVLAIDVMEHVGDHIHFLRRLHDVADLALFHIPLDLSMRSLVRAAHLGNTLQRDGHLHFFTKDLALATLAFAGYQIVDHCYTPTASVLPHRSLRRVLASALRGLLNLANPDLSIRVLGGASLMVLARHAVAKQGY